MAKIEQKLAKNSDTADIPAISSDSTQEFALDPFKIAEKTPAEQIRIKDIIQKWSTFERNHPNLPAEVITASRNVIETIALRRSVRPEEEDAEPITGVFFVIVRDSDNPALTPDEQTALNDTKVIPAFDRQYNTPMDEVESIWRSFGALRGGRVKGKIGNKAYNIAIVSLPMTSYGIDAVARQAKSESERLSIITQYATPAFFDGMQFAASIATPQEEPHVWGLGGPLASMTNHGKLIEMGLQGSGVNVVRPSDYNVGEDGQSKEDWRDENKLAVRLVTGHNSTSAAIVERARANAELEGKPLSEQTIMFEGANGSICKAVMEVLAEEVGGLVLHDRQEASGRIESNLQKLAAEITEKHPMLEGKIKIHFGKNTLEEAIEQADMLITASAEPYPYLGDEQLGAKFKKTGKKLLVIDDGMPPNVHKNGETFTPMWVTVDLPGKDERTLDYGIRGEFGCLAEVVLAHQVQNIETTGKTTPQRVQQVLEAWQEFGIRAAQPESYGELIDLNVSGTHGETTIFEHANQPVAA